VIALVALPIQTYPISICRNEIQNMAAFVSDRPTQIR
jgi:hypothetical protein